MEESKANKRKKQELEEAKQLAEGNKDKVIESLRDRLSSFEEKEELDSIAVALQKEADKRNCPDWDLMYNAIGNKTVSYNKETGGVTGVETFFDTCEMDERLRRVYFKESAPVITDNSTPALAGTVSYSKDPLGYLTMIQEKHPERYQETVMRMQREGLIN